jgi:hypothetical protein
MSEQARVERAEFEATDARATLVGAAARIERVQLSCPSCAAHPSDAIARSSDVSAGWSDALAQVSDTDLSSIDSPARVTVRLRERPMRSVMSLVRCRVSADRSAVRPMTS